MQLHRTAFANSDPPPSYYDTRVLAALEGFVDQPQT